MTEGLGVGISSCSVERLLVLKGGNLTDDSGRHTAQL